MLTKRFAQTTTLLRFNLWQSKVYLLLWTAIISLFACGYVPAFAKIARGQGKLGLFSTMKNPAITAFVGPLPVKNPSQYTTGVMYGHELTLFLACLVLISSGFYVINHTRKTEENGQLELLTALPVGRQANSSAVILSLLLQLTVIFGLVLTGLLIYGIKSINFNGSLFYATTLWVTGLVGGGLAFLFSQCFNTASQAKAWFLITSSVLYILRASSDITNLTYSKFNPLAWTYLGAPFYKNNWSYLLALVILAALLFGSSFHLEANRDLGASYLTVTNRNHTPSKLLSSPLGFLVRLNFKLILAWLMATGLCALLYGSIYKNIRDFATSNAFISQIFANDPTKLIETFSAIVIIVLVTLSLIAPLVIIARLKTEEAKQRLALLIAHGTTRLQLYYLTSLLALSAGILNLVTSGLVLGLSAKISLSQTNYHLVMTCFKASLNYLPLLFIIVGSMLVSLSLFSHTYVLVEAFLGYSFCLTYFNNLLDLPKALMATSMFSWLAKVPLETFELANFSWLLLIGLGLILVGSLLFKQKQLL